MYQVLEMRTPWGRIRRCKVVQRIKAVEGQTQLLVVDKETDEELRRRQLTCTEEMAQRGLPPVHDPWEPKRDWIHSGSLNSEAGQKAYHHPPGRAPPLRRLSIDLNING
uniref:SLC9A3 regulator 2 n=1 Tax=Rousettus aegyptiacus TaxID=9407 RepID=A0A7J8F3I7_ROUAE|nr:SLC9A3 regulator 2 [Rousettus aegyptiacus]